VVVLVSRQSTDRARARATLPVASVRTIPAATPSTLGHLPSDHRQAGRTHIVTNQPPPLVGHDVLTSDVALVEAVEQYGGSGASAALSSLERLAGSEQAQWWGAEANACPPVLRTHDRYGHRVDEVEGGTRSAPCPPVSTPARSSPGRRRRWREGAGPLARDLPRRGTPGMPPPPHRLPPGMSRPPEISFSTLSPDISSAFQMLAPSRRFRETAATLGDMTGHSAHLVARLHVDHGHVSSAVCMAG